MERSEDKQEKIREVKRGEERRSVGVLESTIKNQKCRDNKFEQNSDTFSCP